LFQFQSPVNLIGDAIDATRAYIEACSSEFGLGNSQNSMRYDLSRFNILGNTVQQIATTIAPGSGVPDWKQQVDSVKIEGKHKSSFVVNLYPKSVYTFVIDNVSF